VTEPGVVVAAPLLPLVAGGGAGRGGHELEVAGAARVGADHRAPAVVVGAVLDVALAGREHGERGRVGRRCATHLVGDGAGHIDADEGVVAGAPDAHVERVVRLLVHQHVGTGRG